MRMIILTVLFLLINLSAFAQNTEVEKDIMTGNLHLDKQFSLENTITPDAVTDEYSNLKKSPFLAGFYSAVIPGAGQLYNKQYWKSALFVLLESAAIAAAVVYEAKGDEQTDVFQAFANKNWDVGKYARFSLDNFDRLNISPNDDNHDLNYYQQNLFTSDNQVNWDVLNQMESDIGGYYSHRLEQFGHQQYYEMIGKYPQFNPGWNDFNNPTFEYGDPVTENFTYYSGERGKANDYYNISSKAVIVIVVNHVISAAEAAFAANSYNRDLKIRLGIDKELVGYNYEFVPKLNLQIRF